MQTFCTKLFDGRTRGLCDMEIEMQAKARRPQVQPDCWSTRRDVGDGMDRVASGARRPATPPKLTLVR